MWSLLHVHVMSKNLTIFDNVAKNDKHGKIAFIIANRDLKVR